MNVRPATRAMIGKTYGRLTITRLSHKTMQRKTWCWASCKCGTEERQYCIASISRGNTRSCGCLRREVSSQGDSTRTHGLSKHPMYRIHSNILRRGGKEILCTRWHNVKFFVKDLEHLYTPGDRCHRININKKFTPSNIEFIQYPERTR